MKTTTTVQKLYCYVDETGQDTKGRYFVVSVIIALEDREQLIDLVESLEQTTGKKHTKWHKTHKAIKCQFIEQVFQNPLLQRKIFYSSYGETTTYQELTVLTVAAAVHAAKRQAKYKASIFIDGLQKSEVLVVSAKLRKIGVSTEKVRGFGMKVTPSSGSLMPLLVLFANTKKATNMRATSTNLGAKIKY